MNEIINKFLLPGDKFMPEMHFKSDSHLPKEFCFIWFNKSPLKMMKNASLFHLKNSFGSQDT